MTVADAAYREEHPLAYVVMHWTHLLSMLVLGLSGLVIHSPFVPLPMSVVREVHMVAAYVVVITLACRVWYALFGRTAVEKGTRVTGRDVRNFVPQPGDVAAFAQTLRYYLFLSPEHPKAGKYNPLQKLAYVAIAALLTAQALTGFLLYAPLSAGALGPDVAWLTAVLGGPVGVRTFHYLLTWVFLAITTVHVYLALTEDIAGIPLMFVWRETVPAEEELHDAV